MTKYKDRKEKEAPYLKDNMDCLSRCSGSFFIKGKGIYEECKNRDKCIKYTLFKNSNETDKEVRFRYVDTFRNCNLYKTFDDSFALKICTYNMIYVNDLACQCILELKEHCPKNDKEALKKIYALEKRVRAYDALMAKIVDDKIDFLADFNLYMDEQVQSKVEGLKNSMESFLRSKDVGNYEFIAYVETARTMVEYSIKIIEKRIESLKASVPDIRIMKSYRLMDIQRIIEDLSNWASRRVKGINLNDSPDILRTFSIVNEALTDANMLIRAINESSENYS